MRNPPTRRAGRLFAIAGIVAVFVATWWVTRSPIFDMRSLRVSGASHVSGARVAALAGLDAHSNVLWLSTSRIERSLERDPWIESATVQRSLPGTVTIAIRERRPVAVAMPGSWLIGADGAVLGRAAGGAVSVPRITPGVRLRAGMTISPARLQLAIARDLPQPLAAAVRSVETNRGTGVSLELRMGGAVELGQPVDLPAKYAALRAVLAWVSRRGIGVHTIDVRAPQAPAVRGATGSPSSS